jgi:adenosine 3'-phospho 5'-phosphosulfate transporter B3
MTLVHELGSVAAVIVGNARKALTIVLSFILFPKPFSIFYVFGVILVFGSVILFVVLKERSQAQLVSKHDWSKTSSDKIKTRSDESAFP